MHTPPGMRLPPAIFYKLKFENWPKIQCILAHIVRVYRGNRTKILQEVCLCIRIKILVPNFGGPSP